MLNRTQSWVHLRGKTDISSLGTGEQGKGNTKIYILEKIHNSYCSNLSPRELNTVSALSSDPSS